jgi:ABC-type transport system involved in cytochrome bd biosynthesis fused ATPase/permease subunit
MLDRRILIYEEPKAVLFETTILAADRYVDELGYFSSKEKAIEAAKEELDACKESDYVFGESAWVRCYAKNRAQEEIENFEKELKTLQEKIYHIKMIVKKNT